MSGNLEEFAVADPARNINRSFLNPQLALHGHLSWIRAGWLQVQSAIECSSMARGQEVLPPWNS